MSLAARLRRAPGRIATGAFILNSGLSKLKGDEQTAQALHGMAAGAYPGLAAIEPKKFLKLLALGEVALGGALLTPMVPAGVAGAGLAGFSGSMLGMWWKTPGMHPPGDPRPTQAGTAVAKDVWMLAIGIGLVVDALLSRESKIGR
ncbi:MAG: hypothetical protein JWO63_1281 [Frankiales bacterium]|jgi:hypothetical protein|nr:hypothetical protein [Frankiales bacterium]